MYKNNTDAIKKEMEVICALKALYQVWCGCGECLRWHNGIIANNAERLFINFSLLRGRFSPGWLFSNAILEFLSSCALLILIYLLFLFMSFAVRPTSISINGVEHHTVQGSKVVLTCDVSVVVCIFIVFKELNTKICKESYSVLGTSFQRNY